MKNNIAILFTFLCFPLSLFAQPEIPDPLKIDAETIAQQGVQSMTCRTQEQNEYSLDEDYLLETTYFDRNGKETKHENKAYEDDQLSEGTIKTNSYRYHGDKLIEKIADEHVFFTFSYTDFEYEEDRLMSSAEKRFGRKYTIRSDYEYYPDGKLYKEKSIYRYARVEVFFYEGERLVKKEYYYDEEDEEPYTVTTIDYTATGKKIQELEIRLQDGDTLSYSKYDAAGRLLYLEANRTDSNYNSDYQYQEFITYDEQGRRTQKKYIPEELANAYITETGEKAYDYVIYTYEEDLLTRVDSFGSSHFMSYTETGQLKQHVMISYMDEKDTLSMETYTYNEQDQPIEVFRKNYKESRDHLFFYEYEGDKLIRKQTVLYGLDEKCRTVYESLPDKRMEQQTKYCDVNGRRLPAHIPGEIIEKHYDESGQLLARFRKYGNHDGSIHTHKIDSFDYANGQLLRQETIEIIQEREHGRSVDHFAYGDNGLLSSRATLLRQDTFELYRFSYQEQKLSRLEFWRYDHQGKPWKVFTIDYNAAGRAMHKTTYSQEKMIKEEFYEYDSRQLLSLHRLLEDSPYSGKTETRKSYTYSFYE